MNLKYTGELNYKEIELEDWFVQMMEDADTEDQWPITSTVYFEGRPYDLLATYWRCTSNK